MKKIVILGVGNILLKDEGVGIHIIKELEKRKLPENIEVIDGGVSSLDILLSMKEIDKLIIVDALKGGKKAGTIYRLSFEDLERDFFSERLSLHQLNIIEGLSIAKREGKLPPDVLIIGVEPKDISWSLKLSSEIEEKLPDIVKIVLKEVYPQAKIVN